MRARSYRKPIIIGLLILAVAATVRWWLPPVLAIAGSDKDTIDSWDSLLRALLAPIGPVVAIIGLWLNYRHAKTVRNVSTVTTVTTVTTQDGLPDETTRHEPAPIPKPPVPYFAHRYPLQENFTGWPRSWRPFSIGSASPVNNRMKVWSGPTALCEPCVVRLFAGLEV